MANCTKLLLKARNSPHNLRFDELCSLAECFGWVPCGGTGSHRVYMHSALGNNVGAMMNFQSRKGCAKPYQVKQLLEAIDGLNHG